MEGNAPQLSRFELKTTVFVSSVTVFLYYIPDIIEPFDLLVVRSSFVFANNERDGLR